MNAPTHTPGPWINTNYRYIDSPSGARIAEVYNHAPGYTVNANLLASAPELLEALKDLVWIAEATHGAQDEVNKALAVIAKAEQD